MGVYPGSFVGDFSDACEAVDAEAVESLTASLQREDVRVVVDLPSFGKYLVSNTPLVANQLLCIICEGAGARLEEYLEVVVKQ